MKQETEEARASRAARRARARRIAVEIVADAMLLAGIGSIAYGISQVSVPCAWIVTGVAVLVQARGILAGLRDQPGVAGAR